MTKRKFTTQIHQQLADTLSPVSLYAKFRAKYHNCLLLESSDYHSKEESYSFICIQPLLTVKLHEQQFQVFDGDSLREQQSLDGNINQEFDKLLNSIDLDCPSELRSFNGLYGYIAYDSIQYFENLKLQAPPAASEVPEFQFSFFKYIIAINHFNDELTLLENLEEGETSQLEEIKQLMNSFEFELHSFESVGEVTSNTTDADFIDKLKRGKQHCARGDVFQVVLSRQFQQAYKGDDFSVYRALRSINPSPYLFYFDYGDFRIMGSSPEAQIKVKNKKAIINPIAGTYRRTGDSVQDKELGKKLLNDKKEIAEHVMLVDLARNDLSKSSDQVQVDVYKEIQFFSHVIHMVSEVSAQTEQEAFVTVGGTFPAGTLTGAPKYRAMQLIDQYENQKRGFYGGAVGFIGLDNSVNLAIAIRSFVSKNQVLYSQAGAGVTINSVEQSELQEVNNKLAALHKAVTLANKL